MFLRRIQRRILRWILRSPALVPAQSCVDGLLARADAQDCYTTPPPYYR